MKTKLSLFIVAVTAGVVCWLLARQYIAKVYASGFSDGTSAMLTHVLENQVHLGPIVVEQGATLSNMAITVITWPEQIAYGLSIESIGSSGSCYMSEYAPHTLISNNSFDFVNAWVSDWK